jgi:DNA polymerase-3 subunit gamma/tau
MWPDILEAVKNRRRFTWILLSQNAQVAGFDGTTLQIGFINAGARDNFTSSGSEGVLKQALSEQFNVQWKIEAIVDPSGGTPQPSAGGGGNGGGGNTGFGPGNGGGFGGGNGAGNDGGFVGPHPAPAPRPAPPASSVSAPQAPAAPAPAAPASAAPNPAVHGSSPSVTAQRSSDASPPQVAPEDDIPEEDDAGLVDSALSGHDLIVRELGATVVEEYTNE